LLLQSLGIGIVGLIQDTEKKKMKKMKKHGENRTTKTKRNAPGTKGGPHKLKTVFGMKKG